MTPSALLPYLAEPGTGAPIDLTVVRTASGEPYDGLLRARDGRVVGTLEAFKFNFVDIDPGFVAVCEEQVRSGAREVDQTRAKSFIDPFSDRFAYEGPWYAVTSYLMGTDGKALDAVARFVAETDRIELQLHKHPWSGSCEVRLDGALLETIDLFNPSTAVPLVLPISCRPGSILSVHPLGTRNAGSQGTQVIVEGVIEYSQDPRPVSFSKVGARNRGGNFAHRFDELCRAAPADGIILDIGGGKRQLDDPRYVNLEYSRYEEPDMFGDATCLPFADDSIDLVYSAAVMEHVRDPLKMGSEIARVLKPGGTALVNAAFMQPIHSEGQHFFNVTTYGLEEAMRDLVKVRSWWDGNLSHMLDWFLRVSGIAKQAEPADLSTFMDIARRFDGLLRPEGLMYIASGVWFEGTKPDRA